MIPLPNGCSRSEFIAYPKNWKQASANISINWYIKYRFYEPDKTPVQKVVKANMNKLKVLKDRQAAMRALLFDEDRLLNEGYNPATNTLREENNNCTILQALQQAYKSISIGDLTKRDLKWMLKTIERKLGDMGQENTPAKEFSRKYVKELLERISSSNYRFNKNRSHLMMLYSELVENEIVDVNPIWDIKKKKTLKRQRVILSSEERTKVKDRLEKWLDYLRFTQIFFHSGTRISELLRIKKEDVDIKNQRIQITIFKGREYRQVWKVIKNIALPFWVEQYENCEPGQYMFSVGLRPGFKKIKQDYVTNRWTKCIKIPLRIKASFYSLKHLHSDEISAGIGLSVAGKHNDHKGTVITMTYAVNERKRIDEIIKTADNSF